MGTTDSLAMGQRSRPPIFTLAAAAIAAVLLTVAWFTRDDPGPSQSAATPSDSSRDSSRDSSGDSGSDGEGDGEGDAAPPANAVAEPADLDALRRTDDHERDATALVAELDLDPNLVEPLADLIEDWVVAHATASLEDPEPGADRRVAADRRRASSLAQLLGDRADAAARWIDRHVVIPYF